MVITSTITRLSVGIKHMFSRREVSLNDGCVEFSF